VSSSTVWGEISGSNRARDRDQPSCSSFQWNPASSRALCRSTHNPPGPARLGELSSAERTTPPVEAVTLNRPAPPSLGRLVRDLGWRVDASRRRHQGRSFPASPRRFRRSTRAETRDGRDELRPQAHTQVMHRGPPEAIGRVAQLHRAPERAARFRVDRPSPTRARRYGLYRYFLIFGLLTFARVTIAEPVP
jgi:hypothetical protein